MKRKFVVKLDIPEDVTLWEMEAYIAVAVRSWRGSLHPEDPLFDLNPETVRVKRISKRRRRR